MKRFIFLTVLWTALAGSLASAVAQNPTAIPKRGKAERASNDVFLALNHYFSDPTATMFELVSADSGAGTLVARRAQVDPETWNQWAFCEVSGLDMLDSFKDGAVTLNVSVTPVGNEESYVAVTAQFTGTYGLGSTQKSVDCYSRGVVEDDVLKVAGAASS